MQKLMMMTENYGQHIYMKLRLANKRIEEVDVYTRPDGSKNYITSADHGIEFDPKGKRKLRQEIIMAFEMLRYT